MAKVQILQGVASEHFSWQPGQVIDMPDDEAAKWADGIRGIDAPKDATVHQSYDPDAIPVAEVLTVDEPAETPEPHGYFPPADDDADDDAGDEASNSDDQPETPERAVPSPETPEKPVRKPAATSAAASKPRATKA